MTTTAIPKSVSDFLQHITDLCGTEHAAWAENFNACFADTLTTTVKRHDDGTTFLLTGDIPAMWLRDSTAQLRPYLGPCRRRQRYCEPDRRSDTATVPLHHHRPVCERLQRGTERRLLGQGRSVRLLQPLALGAQVRGGFAVLPHPVGLDAVCEHRQRRSLRCRIHRRRQEDS